MDNKSDRNSDYWLWHLEPETEKFEFWTEIKMSTEQDKVSLKV